jgi:hypothetical protein
VKLQRIHRPERTPVRMLEVSRRPRPCPPLILRNRLRSGSVDFWHRTGFGLSRGLPQTVKDNLEKCRAATLGGAAYLAGREPGLIVGREEMSEPNRTSVPGVSASRSRAPPRPASPPGREADPKSYGTRGRLGSAARARAQPWFAGIDEAIRSLPNSERRL